MPFSDRDPTTSDEEDLESLGQTDTEMSGDSGESGDEVSIGKADSVPVVQTCYHKYISSEPMPSVRDQYECVREGNLHIGLPEASDPMPTTAADWSVLHDVKNNEYVSALRVKQDADANVVRFYILTNQVAWQQQTRNLFKGNKLTSVQVANLSLAVHNGSDFDKTLLDHPELAKYKVDGKIDHIFDTAWAKSVISKAERKAKQKSNMQQKKAAAKKKTEDESNQETAAASDETEKPKPKKKRKQPHSQPIVEDSGDDVPLPAKKLKSTPKKSPLKSPSKQGTTPEKSPSINPKKPVVGRQLKLQTSSPTKSTPKVFREVAFHMRKIMSLLSIPESE